jgi:hypothetical protein
MLTAVFEEQLSLDTGTLAGNLSFSAAMISAGVDYSLIRVITANSAAYSNIEIVSESDMPLSVRKS